MGKHAGGTSIINMGSVVSSLTPPSPASLPGSLALVKSASTLPGMVDTEGVNIAGFIGSDLETGAVAQTQLGRIWSDR